MGFNERISLAGKFESAVESYCRRVSHDVARNGTEHTHPKFVRNLRSNETPAALFIRFAPDGIMRIDDDVIHWEAKASKNVEKLAYNTYIKYSEAGCSVILFFLGRVEMTRFRWKTMPMWVHVPDIKFIDSIKVVGRFPEKDRHPIDQDGWISPRSGNGNSGSGSGTPYKEIDPSCGNIIHDFYGYN